MFEGGVPVILKDEQHLRVNNVFDMRKEWDLRFFIQHLRFCLETLADCELNTLKCHNLNLQGMNK
eukprot:UN03341